MIQSRICIDIENFGGSKVVDDNSKRIKGQRRFVFPNIPYEDRMACVCICIILIKKITRDTSLISGDFPDLIWRRGYDLRNIKATDNRFDGSRNVDDHGLPFDIFGKDFRSSTVFSPLKIFSAYIGCMERRMCGESVVWVISSILATAVYFSEYFRRNARYPSKLHLPLEAVL